MEPTVEAPPLLQDLERVRRQWKAIERGEASRSAEVLTAWRATADELRAVEASLRHAGRWVSGPADLMTIVGAGLDEVRHCRMLRWLLDPASPHGFGTAILDALLASLALPPVTRAERVEVVVEEQRADARADLVIRAGDRCVLIEAKVSAPETGDQCDRMHELWADEKPVLVFLTIDGRPPARSDPRPWQLLRWEEIAGLLDAALRHAAAPKNRAELTARTTCEQHLETMRRRLT